VFDQEALGNPLKALLDGRRIALMCFEDVLLESTIETTARVRMPRDAAAYGQILYSTLRALDSEAYDLILVEKPPETEAWRAIHDRLQKASHDSQHLLASPLF
jgi:L-threonylcarbamoyladenylate synthase